MALRGSDYKYIRLLELGPFERGRRGGWRFGTRSVATSVVARLIASGRAASDGNLVWLVKTRGPETTTYSGVRLTQTECDILRTIVFSGFAMLRDFSDAEQQLIGSLQSRGLVSVKPGSAFLAVTEAGRAVMAKSIAMAD